MTLRGRNGQLETWACPEGTSFFFLRKIPRVPFLLQGNVKRMRALTFSFNIVVSFRIVPILLCQKVHPLSGWMCNLRMTKGTEQWKKRSPVPFRLLQHCSGEGWSPRHGGAAVQVPGRDLEPSGQWPQTARGVSGWTSQERLED